MSASSSVIIADSFRGECHQIIDREREFLLVVSTATVEGAPCFMTSVCGRLSLEAIEALPPCVKQALTEAFDRIQR